MLTPWFATPVRSVRSSSGQTESKASMYTRPSPGIAPPPPLLIAPPCSRLPASLWPLSRCNQCAVPRQCSCPWVPTTAPCVLDPQPHDRSSCISNRSRKTSAPKLHYCPAGCWRTCTAGTCTSGITMTRQSSSPSRSRSCQVRLCSRQPGLPASRAVPFIPTDLQL